MSAEYSIPVFAPRTSKSRRTARSCARTSSTGRGKIESTARVFWAVTHVITLVPWTPTAAKLFRSAWIPAPPPESLPAIVRAVFIAGRNQGVRLKIGRGRGERLCGLHSSPLPHAGPQRPRPVRPVRDVEKTTACVPPPADEVLGGER